MSSRTSESASPVNDPPRHVAIIPARAGSKGIPGKNRHLFSITAEFINQSQLFDQVIVTSDDTVLLDMAEAQGYDIRQRPPELAADDTSLRPVYEDVAASASLGDSDYVWSVLIPLVFKSIEDFSAARRLVDDKRPNSLSSFVRAKSHPYYCWRFDDESGGISRFVDHDTYRRQDLPEAWLEYQIICATRVGALAGCNRNLIRPDTLPFKLTEAQFEQIVDVDEPGDFEKWRRVQPDLFNRWLDRLPADVELAGLQRERDKGPR